MITTVSLRQKSKSRMFKALQIKDELSVNTMVTNFNSFWQLNQYQDEVSSFKFYPIQPKSSQENYGLLNTASGSTHFGVNVRDIYQSTIYCVGEYNYRGDFNNFLDYKGYTHIKCYLPFLGLVDIDVNEIIKKYFQVFLAVDFTTGMGTYFLTTSSNSVYSIDGENLIISYEGNYRIFATYECNVAIDIPKGSTQFDDIMRNVVYGTIKTAGSIALSLATGGLAPTVTTSTFENITTRGADITKSIPKNAPKGTRLRTTQTVTHGDIMESGKKITTTEKPFNPIEPVSSALNGTLNILNKSYPSSPSDRASSPATFSYVHKNLYIIVYRPIIAVPQSAFQSYYGLPCGEPHILSECEGYTKVSSVHINGLENATSSEIDLIKTALYDGIII